MDDLLRKKAELILIYSVPILSTAESNSRLAGLQRKLQKLTVPLLRNLTGFTNVEFNHIIHMVLAWGKETGWLEDVKHTGALVSFCMEMIENSKFSYPDKIMKTLRNIALHLEDGKELYETSCTDGAMAAAAWERMFKPKG